MALNKALSNEKLIAIAALIEAQGMESFVIAAAPDENQQSFTRFNKIGNRTVMNIALDVFFHALDSELSSHPEYTKSYAKIFTDLKATIKEAVVVSNGKVVKYNDKSKKES